VDRVSTTGTVWLGTTTPAPNATIMFDPITRGSFISSTRSLITFRKGIDGHPDNPVPSLKIPPQEQAVQLIDYLKAIPEAEKAIRIRKRSCPSSDQLGAKV
jgi:hypothetical protein